MHPTTSGSNLDNFPGYELSGLDKQRTDTFTTLAQIPIFVRFPLSALDQTSRPKLPGFFLKKHQAVMVLL
jgi:hypothetical protein